ncbi:hypothetical protein NIES4071_92710 [Calothrix sp. NIES-4071]|nr:hypothetical protein NIES4071_92710 [Calothrix sp. NIES-4071]BAZ63538.1 hypothetical protein NIES4105_92640 [Calothrix sp. NIES-4105]
MIKFSDLSRKSASFNVALANMELHFANFSKSDRLLLIIVSAGISLGVGETVDLLFLPSLRY